MSEINPTMPRTPVDILSGIDKQVKELSGGNAEKAKEVYKQVAELLSGENIKVVRSGSSGVDGNTDNKTSGATGTPVLDNPDDIQAMEADLAKLIAFLQLDNEERQTEMAKDRIEMQKANLDTEHENRMKEINDSIKKMEDAEKAAMATRIFGWIGAILAVAAAAVLTVVTGGAAAAFAIAGAAIAVTSLILNETGAMEKITEKLADHLQQEYGMSANEAKLAASLIINLSIMAVSLVCSVGGMAAGFASMASAASNAASAGANAVRTVSQAAKTAQSIITVVNTGVGAGALAAGGLSTYFTKESEDAQADVTELQKFLTTLQQRLDESEEELQALLQMIEAALGQIAEIIGSATDTSKEIAEKIGEMA